MRKAFILIAGSILLYSFFRELNMVITAIICLGLGAVYAIYRIPGRYIVSMKYPSIFLTLAVTASFLIYPQINIQYPLDALIVFLSFYGLTYYLTTIDEKAKSLFKQAVALSIIFLCSAFNLSMIGKPLFIFPMSITAMLFLFIINKHRLIAFLGGYLILITALLFSKGTRFMGELKMSDMDKYLLLAASFILLVAGLVGFVKKSNSLALMAFFGFLYIATDIFMVLGFGLSMGLLYQPVTALLVLAPLIGIMLKTEKERI